jgi:hypothetical protein
MKLMLAFLGAITGTIALGWRIWDEFGAFLRIGLELEAPSDGWTTALTTIENKGYRRKRVSYAILLVGPESENPIETAKLLASKAGHTKPITCTNDLEFFVVPKPVFAGDRAIIPLLFYFSENVWISDETVTYRAPINIENFAPAIPYAVRFYVFGVDRLHRSTQDAFILESSKHRAPAMRGDWGARMRGAIFVGQNELSEAQNRVGMIVGACAQLEHAVTYLQWQLTAFLWDADNPMASQAEGQAALRAKRHTWGDKFAPLTARLTSATAAFEASLRVNSTPRLQEMREQWNNLHEQAKNIARKRNEIAHTSLCWHEGMVKREVGRPWGDLIVVSLQEDEAIASAIGTLISDLGVFTTELGHLLPFADDDQIHTIVLK